MTGAVIGTERFKRGQRMILILLLAATCVAWVWLVLQNSPGGMKMDMGTSSEEMDALMSGSISALTIVQIPPFGMFLPMWVVMSIAMMLPTAIPMILAVQKLCVKNGETKVGNIYLSVLIFTAAYCIIWALVGVIGWGVFYVIVSLIRDWLADWKNVWTLVGVLFLFCGIYQVSPLKNACLTGCQHPFLFLAKNYAPGKKGAFVMGLKHGVECSGCCWGLMLAMLPLGMMNIVWMGIFTILMTVEKNAKYGTVIGKIVGYILIFTGAVVLVMAGIFSRLF